MACRFLTSPMRNPVEVAALVISIEIRIRLIVRDHEIIGHYTQIRVTHEYLS